MNKEAKSINRKEPIENHRTAALADIEEVKSVSNVAIPSDSDVYNAKDYVDANEK